MNVVQGFGILALQLLIVATACAQSIVNNSETVDQHRTLNHKDVGGIVIGQTITLAGRAFFDRFALAWSEKDETGTFIVAITERPTARLDSQVFVDCGNRRLFQTFLPPNRAHPCHRSRWLCTGFSGNSR